jgi:polysaccharide biosynthesis PFTS motif protein
MMRGVRILRKTNQLTKIFDVKLILANTPLSIPKNSVSKFLWGAGFAQTELITRQYLLTRIGGHNLNKALLYFIGNPYAKVVYPLPAEWQKILLQNGFKIARVRSTLLWHGYVFLFLGYGITGLGRQLLNDLKEIIKPKFSSLGCFVYFSHLAMNNLPKIAENHDQGVIDWYLKWKGKVENIDTICHSVKGISTEIKIQEVALCSTPSAILPFNNIKTLIRFFAWAMCACVFVLLSFVRGRWWHVLLFNEALLAAKIRMQNQSRLAKEYLFHNSGWIYRPLWTYEAEQREAQISFYFYSTNCEGFKKINRPIPYGWNTINWPRYLVWDEYQSNFVRKVAGDNVTTIIVGPIGFTTGLLHPSQFPIKTIAVFDVQPIRDSLYAVEAPVCYYYIPKTCIQFLADIYKVLNKHNITLALKRKRNIGKNAHPKYEYYVDNISKCDNFFNIDARLAPSQIITNCLGVISMPFTSTALIGRELGLPSVYYDPHGFMQKDDPAAHGIEILIGPKELEHWIASVLQLCPLNTHGNPCTVTS